MSDHRHAKRARSTPEQSSTNSEEIRKLCKLSKKEHTANIYTSSASDSHLCLLNEEKDCDVTFLVGPSNERIHCHQLFLKARSPVFQAMFSDRWNEGNKEIKLPDIHPVTFRAFLQFLYADECPIVTGSDEALDVLYVAQKYDVQPLVKKCEKFFKSNLALEDCVKVIRRGRAFGNENLVEMAGDFLTKANSLQVIASEKVLKEMDEETLTYLLRRDDMRAKEVELFGIALAWGKIQVKLGASSTVKEALADIIPHIRFPTMTLNEFTTVVVPTGLLPESALVPIFTYFGSIDSIQKDLATSLKFSTVPRKAQLPAALMTFYGRPIGHEEVSKRMVGRELQEYIRFRVSMSRRGGRDYNVQYNSCGPPKRLAVTCIILNFPFRNDRSAGNSGQQWRNGPCDSLKISFMKSPWAVDSDFECSDRKLVQLFEYSAPAPAKYEWGKELEVKLEPHVVIDYGDYCKIKVHQVNYSSRMRRYQPPSFGPLQANDLDLGFDGFRLTDVTRGSQGLGIIHKIGFVNL